MVVQETHTCPSLTTNFPTDCNPVVVGTIFRDSMWGATVNAPTRTTTTTTPTKHNIQIHPLVIKYQPRLKGRELGEVIRQVDKWIKSTGIVDAVQIEEYIKTISTNKT